jgi:hypothetical protein
MTWNSRCDSAFSRRGSRPSCARSLSLNKQRAQGKPGANAPAASRAKVIKHTSIVTTGSPNWSGLPCAMVYGLYVLPGERLFCRRRLQVPTRKLDSSVAKSGPHDFAVRLSRHSSTAPPRPLHPAPRFVTTRTPLLSLVEAGHEKRTTISDFRKAIFRPGLEIPISLNPLTKLAFGRKRFRIVERRASEMNRYQWIKLSRRRSPRACFSGSCSSARARR